MFSKLSGFVHPGESHETSAPQSQEQSLTTILATHEERTQLLLLVAGCMESMKQQVIDIFDPDKTANREVLHLSPTAASARAKQVKDEHDQSEGSSIDQKPTDQNAAQLVDSVHKDKTNRAQELSEAPMADLRKAALDHFETWRDRVVQRIGEVINHTPSSADKVAENVSTTKSHQANSGNSSITDDIATIQQQFPPQATPLVDLDQPQKVLILHSLLLLLLSLESYTAESRILMLRLTSSLALPLSVLVGDEAQVAKGLLEAAKQQMNADQETKDKAEASANSRKWKVGLGAAAGAVLIGVTGGLAAPLLAAGVGSIMGGIGLGATATAGYLGAMAGSAPLVGVLFGAYGGKMTGQMVDKYAKEVEDFAFIPVHKPSTVSSILHSKASDTNARHLRVAIGISGWLTEEAEVVTPWQVLGGTTASSTQTIGTETFALRYELKALLNLGHGLTTYIKSYAWSWAKRQLISRTIFAALSSALASAIALPYGMAKAAKIVDNPFQLAKSRTDKAGRVLADALIHKVQGERPVTLIGYSLGARAIYACLLELADRRAFGLIENIVLIGSPSPSDSTPWRKIRSVVSGRVVNVFSANDYLLSFLYRTSSLQLGIAGLQAIPDVTGIENVDASQLVDGHLQYRYLIGSILSKINLEDVNENAVAKQLEQFKLEEKKAREAKEAADDKGDDKKAENEAKEMETEVASKNKASQAFDWVSQKMASLTTSPVEAKDKGRRSFEGDDKENVGRGQHLA